MIYPPEAVAIVGGALWILAALITGIPRGRVPSAFPFLFSIFGAVGGLLGMTTWTGTQADLWLLAGAAILYVLTPIGFTAWLLHHYDHEDGHGKENPRTVT